jgi:tetratricopeptide (TPR) repeat protein
MYPFTSFGWSPLRSLSSESYHYIEAPNPELYDLVRDPKETHNLIGSADVPAVASVLRQRINDLRAKYPKIKSDSAAAVSTAAEEKLRALGYMSFHSVKAGAEAPLDLADPKDKIGELNDIMRASDAIQAKRFSEGEALLEKVRRADPQLYLVPFLLGEAALEQRDWATAQRELEKCLELNPAFDQAMTALSRALVETSDEAGARNWLDRAIDVNPSNYRAWYQLARIEIATDPAKAMTALEKTLTIQPNFALAHRDLGLLQIQQKAYSSAIIHLEAAAKGGADSAELYNSLGIAYSQTKKPTAAIDNFEKSVALNRDLAEAHLNLAFELQKAGRFSRSKAEYAEACRLAARFCRYVPN